MARVWAASSSSMGSASAVSSHSLSDIRAMARNSERLTLPSSETSRSPTAQQHQAIAQQDTDKQHTDKGRQLQHTPLEAGGHMMTHLQAQSDQRQRFNQRKGSDGACVSGSSKPWGTRSAT